jgi:hypothetical protein
MKCKIQTSIHLSGCFGVTEEDKGQKKIEIMNLNR